MKRFYKTVSISPDGPPYALLVDGKPVLTPQRRKLELPTRGLAEAVAEEWRAQGERIVPATMPLTRLAHGAIDFVAPDPSQPSADITAYAGSDLLCYRADAPAELVARQASAFDPVLAWAAEYLGSGFKTVVGVMPQDQPAETLAAVAGVVAGRDPFRLVGLHAITTLTGSTILALALNERRISARDAWTAAHIDEDWQIAQWGEDAAAARRREGRHDEFTAAHRLLELL